MGDSGAKGEKIISAADQQILKYFSGPWKWIRIVWIHRFRGGWDNSQSLATSQVNSTLTITSPAANSSPVLKRSTMDYWKKAYLMSFTNKKLTSLSSVWNQEPLLEKKISVCWIFVCKALCLLFWCAHRVWRMAETGGVPFFWEFKNDLYPIPSNSSIPSDTYSKIQGLNASPLKHIFCNHGQNFRQHGKLCLQVKPISRISQWFDE